MITDVSSVGLDFLYLHSDRPLFVADRYDDRTGCTRSAPMSRCADVVDSGIARRADRHAGLAAGAWTMHRAEARDALRRHYFGDLAPGESTERFLAAIGDAIRDRDAHGVPAARPPPDRGPILLGAADRSSERVVGMHARCRSRSSPPAWAPGWGCPPPRR